MTIRIIFETHSTTTDNERGIATGWLPGELSAAGNEQARALGERRREGIDAVFVSDLARAVETAEVAFAGRAIPIYRDRRLRECNYGDRNGQPVAQLHQERLQHITKPWPGGQSYLEVAEGMKSFLQDLSVAWDGRTVLLIGHSATRWALDYLLKGIPLEDAIASPSWQPGWEYGLP